MIWKNIKIPVKLSARRENIEMLGRKKSIITKKRQNYLKRKVIIAFGKWRYNPQISSIKLQIDMYMKSKEIFIKEKKGQIW